jgi:Fe-S oxidoreductase
MWMEEERSQRPGMQRAEELLATGAEAVAVGCPFCKVMIGDSVAQAGGETPPILDIAEVMLAAITRSQAPGEPKDAADPAGTQPT